MNGKKLFQGYSTEVVMLGALVIAGYMLRGTWIILRQFCKIMSSEDLTLEVALKNVSVCLLIGLGFSVWLLLELAGRIFGFIPSPDEIHGRYA